MASVAYVVFCHEEIIRKRLRKIELTDKPILSLPIPDRHEAINIDPYIDAINKKSVISIQNKLKRMKQK